MKRFDHTGALCAVLAILAFLGGTAHAAMIGFHHDGGGNQPVVGPAGVPEIEQINWNSVHEDKGPGAAGSLETVVDSSGAVVAGMSITWSANACYTNGTHEGENGNLFYGGLEAQNTAFGSNEITVTGIPYDTYDVYVYVNGWTAGRTGYMRINGDAGTEMGFNTYQNFPDTWVQASGVGQQATHVLFEDVTGGALTIEFRRGSSNIMVGGFQIVPEPATLALTACGLIALLRRRRA
jgi:hypothetical protein